MVEAVGVLGNLSIPNLDFDRLFRQFRLVDWVKAKLTSGESQTGRVIDILCAIVTAFILYQSVSLSSLLICLILSRATCDQSGSCEAVRVTCM